MAPDPSTGIIQFARSPQPGGVKTRMLPVLSPEQACQLHCDLVLWTCRTLVGSGVGKVELAVAGERSHPIFDQCRELGVASVEQQVGTDLGGRMCHAIEQGLRAYSAVLLVGSDCPGIDTDYLIRAQQALVDVPVVLGPAEDGGYVLIGMRIPEPRLFTGISWGSAYVLAQTRERLVEVGLDWQEMEPLADIDRPEDLQIWESLQEGGKSSGPQPPGMPRGRVRS